MFSPLLELDDVKNTRSSNLLIKIIVFEEHIDALVDTEESDCKDEVDEIRLSAYFFLLHDSFGDDVLGLFAEENVDDHLDEKSIGRCSVILT